MTLQEIADSYVENKFSYVNKFDENDTIEITTEQEYNRIKAKYYSTVEQLKAIQLNPTSDTDFAKVDALYSSKFVQQAIDIDQNIADNIANIISEANSKIASLNKPIEDNWNKLKEEHSNLVELQERLNKYKSVIDLYYRVTKDEIIPIDKIDIVEISNKTSKIDSIVNTIRLAEKILDIDDLYFTLGGLGLLLLLMTPLSFLLILIGIIGTITVIIMIYVTLKQNIDLVSFSLQTIEDLDENKYHKLYTFEDDIFNEYQVRINEQEERSTSKEVQEIRNKGKGEGKEEYRNEFIKLLEPANNVLNEQLAMSETIKNNIASYEEKYKSEHKYLGQRYSTDPVLNYDIVYNKGQLFESSVNIKNKVISIIYKDYKSRDNALKLLILSIYSNIIFTNLRTIIYDKKYFGEFASTMGYLDGNDHGGNQIDLTVYDKDLGSVIEVIKEHIRLTQKKRKGISIDEYNENSKKDINLPTQYLLCILDLDAGKGVDDDNAELQNKELINILDAMYENGCILIVCSARKFKCNKEIVTIS